MGDPRQTFHLPVEGEPAIRFTNTAIAMAERLTQKTTPQLAAHIFSGAYGIDTLNRVALAGLEGARLKNRTGGREWKLSQVEDLIEEAVDEGATFEAISTPIVDALEAALAKWFPEDEEPADPPPTAAGTGTTSSEPPHEPESTSEDSGN